MLDWTAEDRRLLGRTSRLSVAAIVAATLLLEVRVLLTASSYTRSSPATLLVYVMPQALMLAVPVGFALGVFIGLGGRIVSRRSTGAVLVLAIVCSVVSFGTIASLVPAANRAFRESLAGDGTSRPGTNELTLSELRQQRDSVMRAGLPSDARKLGVYYHTRWALSCAPLALTLVALSVVTRRHVRRSILGVAFCGALVSYYLLFRAGTEAGLHGALPAFAAAWLPNVVFAVVSAAVTKIHSRSS